MQHDGVSAVVVGGLFTCPQMHTMCGANGGRDGKEGQGIELFYIILYDFLYFLFFLNFWRGLLLCSRGRAGLILGSATFH